MTPTTEGVEPFEYTFDLNDDHCSRWVLDQIAEDLPARLVARLANPGDIGEADERCRMLLADDAACLADADRDALEGLRSILQLHLSYYCSCANDAWSSEEDAVNELLSSIDVGTFAVTVRDEKKDEGYDDVLTVSKLFELLQARYGWSSLELSWDASALTAVFGNDHGRWGEIVLTALSPAQATIAGQLDSWSSAPRYHSALGWSDALIELVTPSLGDLDDFELDVIGFVDALAAQGVEDPNVLDTAVVLARDWDAGPAALASAAVLLTRAGTRSEPAVGTGEGQQGARRDAHDAAAYARAA